jgi:hypothetical protein
MVKKRITTTKKKKGASNPSTSEEVRMERVLIENFISLQGVMTNLAGKFNNLSGQISKLLELFEISAKTLAEKGSLMEDNKFIEKLDNLIEQNKVIARGVALIHEKGSEPQYPSHQRMQKPVQYPPQQLTNRNNRMEGYQESPSAEFSTNQNLRR